MAYAMRGEVGETGEYVGLAVICRRQVPTGIEARVFFGSFPGRGKRVQLAVKDPAGRVERFGPVLSGSPAAGFHSPLLSDSEEAMSFARAALQPGSLFPTAIAPSGIERASRIISGCLGSFWAG